jgi:hypothetical protein
MKNEEKGPFSGLEKDSSVKNKDRILGKSLYCI